jgi:F-type H+-transporting ATPase subunit delta
MRSTVVSRNYAETLLALAERHGGAETREAFGAALADLAEAVAGDPRIRAYLESPRVEAEQKQRVLRTALEGRAPDLFVRFVLVVVEKRRAALLGQISGAYRDLVDARSGRVRAEVTLPHEADEAFRNELTTALEKMLERTVTAEFRTDPALIGGVVVRVGDTVLDGSVRRRAGELRRRLLKVNIPAAAGA